MHYLLPINEIYQILSIFQNGLEISSIPLFTRVCKNKAGHNFQPFGEGANYKRQFMGKILMKGRKFL